MTRDLLRSWHPLLERDLETEHFQQLKAKLREEYTNYKVCPAPHDVFKIFQLLDVDKVRVVIIGQDPYPNDHADGLAFSSQKSDTPFSLQRILREVDRDVWRTKDYKEFKRVAPSNSLIPWVNQGVMLLNTVLTVRAGDISSHKDIGWQQFTTRVLEIAYDNSLPKVFVAWGTEAQKLTNHLGIRSTANHLILEAGHPASGAHGKDKFSGCSHFSKINRHFEKLGLSTINWKLT